VLDGDTGFDKPVLTPYEQGAYRRAIADYLHWQDSQIGAKLLQRADAIFGPGGEASGGGGRAGAWSRGSLVLPTSSMWPLLILGVAIAAALALGGRTR